MDFEEIFKKWTLEQKVEWALGPNICNLSNQMRSIIVDLKNENARLKAQLPKWISVKDMLPPKNKEFIGLSIKGSVSPCWFQFPEHAIGHLSHWMPLTLPLPPAEESSEKENG